MSPQRPAEQDAASARLSGRRRLGEETLRHAVRHDVDAIGGLPAPSEREGAIEVVQQDQPIGGARGRGDLRQAQQRMDDAPRPRFVQQTGVVILEHAAVVEVLEAVGPGDHRRAAERAETPEDADPEAVGARDVHDVVTPARAHHAAHGLQHHDRSQRLAQVVVARPAADAVGEQQIAVVSERAEFLLQLDEHLRRAEPRVRRIVTGQQNAHARARLRRRSLRADRGGGRATWSAPPRRPIAASSRAPRDA